jgi:hypothetical protein
MTKNIVQQKSESLVSIQYKRKTGDGGNKMFSIPGFGSLLRR